MSSDNIRFKVRVDLPNRFPQTIYCAIRAADNIETIEDLKRMLKAMLNLNNDYGIDLFIADIVLSDGSDLSIIRDEETIVVRDQTDWETRSDSSVEIIPVIIKSEPIDVIPIDDSSSNNSSDDLPPHLAAEQIRQQISPLIGLPSNPRNKRRLNSTESSVNSSTQTSDGSTQTSVRNITTRLSARLTRVKSIKSIKQQKPKLTKKPNTRFVANTRELVPEKRVKKPKIYKDFYCFY